MKFFFLCFLSIFTLALAEPRTSISGLYCGKNRLSTTTLVPTFVEEMEGISQQITDHHFATFHLSNSSTTLYTLAQCFGDLSTTDCLLCYAACRTKVPRCLPNDAARIYLDGCFLRYDNYSFYGESVKGGFDTVKCSDENVTLSSEVEKVEFRNKVGFAVGNVSESAVRNEGFGVGEVGGVYALAQCWQSVGKDGCRACLEKAEKAVRGCGLKKEGRGMNAGCYLRYSTEKFYNEGGDSQHNGKFKLAAIVGATLAAAAVLMLLLCALWAGYAIFKNKQRESNDLKNFSTSLSRAGLNFKYEALEKATYYFSPSRKIGQGGSGSVYLGTLSSGQNVAVKRLVFNTRQWVDEFFNEVNLISGIQHKNLVKLLGCSIEGPESLLVWKLYTSNRLSEAVDPRLNHNFPTNDASNVLQIGLLCTQASVNLRPSMDEVVEMLSGEHYQIPTPSQPPFLNPRVVDNTANCSTISLATQLAPSYTSSGSTTMNSSDGPPSEK
ncbi:hypothetical protein ACFE04_006830 [Oxalis oulophora]